MKENIFYRKDLIKDGDLLRYGKVWRPWVSILRDALILLVGISVAILILVALVD